MDRNFRFMRFPGGKFRAFTLSYDDGVGTDLRLMDIMKRNGIKGTFNLCSGISDDPKDNIDIEKNPTHKLTLPQISEYYKDVEVATHGMTHPFYKDLPDTALIYEIVKDREVFEKMFSKRVLGHAYPNGSFKESTVACLEACGVIYARTTAQTMSFEIPDNWLKYGATCHHSADLNMLYDKFFVNPRLYKSPYLFTVWGHSYEFEDNGNWDVIESFLDKMGGKDNVWYAGLGEIVEYTNAYRSLVYSIDSNIVYNPTALDVWISTTVFADKAICIPSGASIKLNQE